jgi:myo-inositol-1(or 4)-monophosphatase
MLQNKIRGGSALINVMASAAMKAARGLIRDFNEVEHLQVSQKGPGDFVSAADHRAEKIIHQELKKARPDFGFLMEESGEISGPDKRHRWIIDPLDGTTNFLHAIPHFCISIALEFEHEILAGVIYDPIKDEIFHAEKGKGAFMNERRLRVSARSHLADTLLGTTRITNKANAQHPNNLLLTHLEKLGKKTSGIRLYGAAALDLCYVAAGRLDAFFAYNLAPWDIAAGLVIVREAGGYVDELTGKGSLFETGSLLASNAKLNEDLKKEFSL